MSTRPTTFPDWATNNPAGIVSPSASQIQLGWQPSQPPAAETANWLQNTVSMWLRYLDGQSNSTILTNTLDHSMRLVGGGNWSFNLATGALSWSTAAYLAIPSIADASNTIPAGTVNVPNGSMAYVQANVPFTTTATTAAGSTQLTNVPYADNVMVGNAASGPGIATGATVTAIDAANGTINLSSAATLSSAGVAVTFSSSGSLTVQVATTQALLPGPNTVVIARGTETSCIVGVGSGQMKVQDGESRYLLENGYGNVGRFTAGGALAQLQAVYISAGAADSRTAGSAYLADASANFATRANVAGIAITAAASGAVVKVATSGVVSGFSGLTPGATYYADPATPGGITASKSTTAGQYITVVGQAISATALMLNVQPASAVPTAPTNFSVPGTLSGGNVVSGAGFKSLVDMGGYGSSSNLTANQVYFCSRNLPGGASSFAMPNLGGSGSILSIAGYNAGTTTATLTVNLLKNGATYASYQQAIGTGSANHFVIPVGAKGGAPFVPNDQWQISFSASSSALLSMQFSMLVEYSA